MPKEDKKKEVNESDDILDQADVCQDCNKPLAKCECRDTHDDSDDLVDDDDDFGVEEGI